MEELAMISGSIQANFWQNKKVFLTGHTGFKGGWLSFWLSLMGAKVYGYALEPSSTPNLYECLGLKDLIESSTIADIRDISALRHAISLAQPDIVIHMAAQPLVRYSYTNPVETYAVNVMGTVHLLEVVRDVATVKAVVVVTTDKCYENKEWYWGYRETEAMGGHDPYSSSKGCAELVTAAYRKSFFSSNEAGSQNVAVASARAGNVIGGGDWSSDRLLPDVLKALEEAKRVSVRNPNSIRPWQHVLEPLRGYLLLAQGLFERGLCLADSWNFGPVDSDARTVQDVVKITGKLWGQDEFWDLDSSTHPHEAHYLKLDISKANLELNWKPSLDLTQAIGLTVDWRKAYSSNINMQSFTQKQIEDYLNQLTLIGQHEHS